MKAQTCWERVKTAASEVEKPQSIQQKSMHRKSETDRSQQKSVYRKGDALRRSRSFRQRRRSEALTGAALGRRRELAEFRCIRGDARVAVQQKDTAHVEHLTHGAKRDMKLIVSHNGARGPIATATP